jgi:hypothetical protein
VRGPVGARARGSSATTSIDAEDHVTFARIDAILGAWR